MKNSLESLRKSRGLLQKDVARMLRLPKSTYAAYESGKYEARYGTLRKLSAFYGVPIERLLSEPEEPIRISREKAKEVRMAFERLSGALMNAGIVPIPQKEPSERYETVQNPAQTKDGKDA